MADQIEDPKVAKPALESLHPSQINLRLCKTKEEREAAEDIIHKWHEKIAEHVRSVLTEHGVVEYQLSYMQDGSKAVLLIRSEGLYNAAKLASSAARALQEQVMEELHIK